MGADGFGNGGPSLPVPLDAEQMMRRCAKIVCSRVPGVRAGYCVRRKTLGFYYRNPACGTTGGPIAKPIYGKLGELIPLDREADAMVRALQLGKVPRKVKEAWERSQEAMREHDERVERRRMLSERMDEGERRMLHARNKRRAYGVQGIKE